MDIQDIQQEIEIAMAQCQTMEAQIRQQAREHGVDVMVMRYADGTSCMMPVVLAKSNLLPALYALEKDREAKENMERIKNSFLERFNKSNPRVVDDDNA